MSVFTELLRREVELLESFAKLLEEEQSILKQNIPDELPALAKKKAPLIEALNAIEAQRNKALATQGFASDREGMQSWLNQHPKEQQTNTLWNSLLAGAKRARDLNDLNGQLVNQQLQMTGEALAVLGHEARRQTLYGANGQSTPLTGNRIIDSA